MEEKETPAVQSSVMMVTYNRLALTKQTLDNLLKNTNIPMELIFVDNGSTDGTVEFLNEFRESHRDMDIKIKFNSENKGIAIARNQALSLATKTWLATIDNDILVPEGWLGEAIDIMTKNPQYGMIGVNMEGVRYGLVTLNGKAFQSKPQGNLGTACAVFSRKLHQMIGFFNTEYEFYGMEDSDYGWRARVAGFKLGYIKEDGKHLGEGENDRGEYREFKTLYHHKNLNQFYSNCRLYSSGKKQIFIPFKE